MRKISLHGDIGPEHVAIGPDGMLYAAVASGRILRISPDGKQQKIFADTGGRGLGLAFDAGGNIVVADAMKGLLSISADGKVTVLVEAGAGEKIRFPNAVAISKTGEIFFTDSSERFAPSEWATTQTAALLDVFEQSATGRILEYDPETRRLRVIATGFSLANGSVLSSDERSLFVSESGRYRIWAIDKSLEAANIAKAHPGVRLVLDNLPGYPDNLTRGAGGRIWVGLAGQRNALDSLATRPFMRELAFRIPRVFWATPQPYGHVIAFLEDGTVALDLQDPGGTSPTTTGATESGQRLYIHNLDGGELGSIAKQEQSPRM